MSSHESFFEDKEEKPSCSVSKELLSCVMSSLPDNIKARGDYVCRRAALFALGFDVSNYYTVKDVYIRRIDLPAKVYKTDIYNGTIRNAVESVDTEGNIKYKANYHHLYDLYSKYPVLQPLNICKYVKDFQDILDIGTKEYYVNGFKNL